MAAKKKLDPATEVPLKDAYYDAMRQAKRSAGLSLESALEVTANQIATDEANGVTPWLDALAEETPEA